MTDQELLRLAALAAGYELEWAPEWPGGGCFMRRVVPEPEPPFSKRVPWNPLEDDGDAFRLAVEMEFSIVFGENYVIISGDQSPSVNNGNDRCLAVRDAIVRAAAKKWESE